VARRFRRDQGDFTLAGRQVNNVSFDRWFESNRRLDDLRVALQESVNSRFAAIIKLMDERYATQETSIRAVDAAVRAALQTAQEGTRDALQTAQEATRAAMVSAEKSVAKSENATDKRFEQMNEFRQSLSDQAANFIDRDEFSAAFAGLNEKFEALRNQLFGQATTYQTRGEYDTAHKALTEKFDIAFARNAEDVSALELRLTHRLDLIEGSNLGSTETRSVLQQNVGQILIVASVTIAFLALILGHFKII